VGFLAPGAFAVGAALLVALLASYLLRPRRPTRRVSTTFLWLAALHDLEAQRPWRRIPPNLLLLLQVIALAAMVGAVARPFVLTPQSTGSFTVVLLDASASMQATDVKPSRFEAARTRVSQLIDNLEPAQQLALVSLDAQPHILAQPTSDHAELDRGLASAQPTAVEPNFAAALSLAGSLAEGHQDAQLVVVGDGSLDRSQVPPNLTLPVRYLGVGTSTAANLTVAGLTTRASDGHLSALARVTNNGPTATSATLTLSVDGKRFDARSLSIDPNATATQQWDDLPPAAHTLEASLDQKDDFALDDAAWAILGGDRPTRVLLVSEGNVFVERALGLRPSTQITRVRPEEYSPQNQAYDLVVLDGFVPPVLPSGASILVLHPPTDTNLLTVGSDTPVSTISAARQGDPLLQDVPLDGTHISQARRLTPPSWADTVLSSPETPLLLVGEQAGHRIGIVGFDVHQSDLPLQPAFPVLMQHLLDWLVPPASTATPVVNVGDAVSLAPLPEAVKVEVVPPSGQSIQVAPPFPAPAFNATTAPGVYQVIQSDSAGRGTASSFAVNFVDATQSRLAPGADSGAPTAAGRADPIRAPREFWEALAVVALLALGIEAALAWWQFAVRALRARIALALRVATAALLLLALLGVGLPQVVDRQATIFVADVSASTQSSQPGMADFIGRAIAAKRPDDADAIVTTAGAAAVDHPMSTVAIDTPALAPAQSADATDLAAGLRLGADLLPTGYRPRLVLLSDGQETTGDAVAQARALNARGVQVDVVPVSPSVRPEVLVDSVSAPQRASEGDRFSIGVRLSSNVATDATVHVQVGDQSIADQQVTLNPGTTDLAFSAQAPQSGLLSVGATVDAAQDTLTQNNSARSVVEVQGPPRVLVVEQRPGEADVIVSALSSTGMRLDRIAPGDLPDQLDALGNYSAVVLADVAATSLTDTQQTALRDYVRDLGRGLLAIGGDTSFGQGDYLNTPLDDLLPVRSSVRSHRDQGRVALLLVMDTSGSMADDIYHEGTTKIDMAKQAAILSAQQLSPRDQVGILSFDSTQHWVLPLTNMLGMSASTIQDRLAPLSADGGTDIFPALSMAFDAINGSDARYKHIILMTDGMSCCAGDYAGLQDRMRAANVTLSTIAIGGDADTDLLSQLARQGDGRYYFADHARDIPRLMTRETDLATRGPLVEGSITPRQVSPDAVLSNLAAGGLPQLGGYLVTSPKDLAEVLLVSDAGDPLLARWQFGLGRAVAWTSDLRGRWSSDWLQWSGTPQLFNAMVNWTIAPDQGPVRLSLRSDGALGHISLSETTPSASPAAVQAHVVAPDGSASEVNVPPSGPGEYSTTFPLSGDGVYLVRVEDPNAGSAEAGLPVWYPAEFRQVSPDPGRMQQIASAGGGHVLKSPADAFADDLPPLTTPVPLQRLLILIAAILLPLEVALRRLRITPSDILGYVRHPHRLDLSFPHWAPDLPAQSPNWFPGVWRQRPAPSSMDWPPRRSDVGTNVSPGLARDSAEAESEESALAAANKWLNSRRTTTGDKH
jgi:Ca-activated chloride channel family protein